MPGALPSRGSLNAQLWFALSGVAGLAGHEGAADYHAEDPAACVDARAGTGRLANRQSRRKDAVGLDGVPFINVSVI
jgi:hypothetical protein